MINVNISDFERNWSLVEEGEDIYTNGILVGKIIQETLEYIVIKLQ